MSVYCVSDIHGNYGPFSELLDDFALTSDDQVYILGDVIDRGPEIASLLAYCVHLNETYDNFHFLVGNHEHMAYQHLLSSEHYGIDEDERRHWIDKVDGSDATIEALNALDSSWVADNLIGFFDDLSFYEIADVAGSPWALVHAGFSPSAFGTHASDVPDDALDVGYGIGVQTKYDMIWIRDGWMDSGIDSPIPVVHGHTPTSEFAVPKRLSKLDAMIGERAYLSENGILYYRNKIDIDAGAGVGRRLAGIRLDDLEEFSRPV